MSVTEIDYDSGQLTFQSPDGALVLNMNQVPFQYVKIMPNQSQEFSPCLTNSDKRYL